MGLYVDPFFYASFEVYDIKYAYNSCKLYLSEKTRFSHAIYNKIIQLLK